MVINTKNYADFKKIVASMSDIDGIFFGISATYNVGGLTVVVAYSADRSLAVSYLASPSVAPNATAIAADFPAAVQLSDAVFVSDQTTFSF